MQVFTEKSPCIRVAQGSAVYIREDICCIYAHTHVECANDQTISNVKNKQHCIFFQIHVSTCRSFSPLSLPPRSSRGASFRGQRRRREPVRAGHNLGRKCLGSVLPSALQPSGGAAGGAGAGVLLASNASNAQAVLIPVPSTLHIFKFASLGHFIHEA